MSPTTAKSSLKALPEATSVTRPVDPAAASPTTAPPGRVQSIDALRGFDMFWIIGGMSVITALHRVVGASWTKTLAEQMEHVDWTGFHFCDLIFPLFIFITGMSLVFSLSQSLAKDGRTATVRKIVRRAAILCLLGVIHAGGISKGWDQVRLLGVLQRIGLSYLIAGVLFCFFKPRGLATWCAALLVGYWALLKYVSIDGFGGGNYTEELNLAAWVDIRFLPLHKYQGKPYDPEGLLSTLPAAATCLLGVFAGLWLKNEKLKPWAKVALLSGAGVACLAIGWGWAQDFPVIKKIWTSSFVLVAGGWSFLLAALFYLVVDVLGWRMWTVPFLWVGANAITIFLLRAFLNFNDLAARLVGGPVQEALDTRVAEGAGALLIRATGLLLAVLLCGLLYQKKVFLRV